MRQTKNAGCQLIIIRPWRMLATPGIEIPRDPGNAAVLARNKTWPAIAGPKIINRQSHKARLVAKFQPRGFNMCRMSDNCNGLELGDGVQNLYKLVLHGT